MILRTEFGAMFCHVLETSDNDSLTWFVVQLSSQWLIWLKKGVNLVFNLITLFFKEHYACNVWLNQSSWNKYGQAAKVTTNAPIYINEVLRYQFVYRKISTLTFETNLVLVSLTWVSENSLLLRCEVVPLGEQFLTLRRILGLPLTEDEVTKVLRKVGHRSCKKTEPFPRRSAFPVIFVIKF